MTRSLPARLKAADDSATVTAFPDGSVDHLYAVNNGDRRICRREAFAEAATSGSPAFTLRPRAVEPGGHAVNMALQASFLGEEVRCVGHLGDPVFLDVPFERVSMGDPARVAIFQFEDGDVLTVEPSTDMEKWSLAALQAVAPSLESLLSADIVFCTNWAAFASLPTVLSELASEHNSGETFLFDPGHLTSRPADEIRNLADALAALGDSFDVVFAANGEEVASLAGALENGGGEEDADEYNEPDDYGDKLARIRRGADLRAAVVHEVDAAVAVTRDGRERVKNVDVDSIRNMGGGDRFDAGLGFALARGWSWADALRLGNACAARYVATGESADRDDLAAFIRDHE